MYFTELLYIKILILYLKFTRAQASDDEGKQLFQFNMDIKENEPPQLKVNFSPSNDHRQATDGRRYNLETSDDQNARRGRNKHKDALRIRNPYPIGGRGKVHSTNVSETTNYPYMAAIIIYGRLWCAGAIVDINWVVTAAHCLNYVLNVSPLKSLGRYVKVRVGSELAHEGGRVVGVAGAVRHPKFEEEPVPHADVALLKLAEHLEFSKTVNLIKIYDGVVEPFAQSFVVISGWGATSASVTAFKEHSPILLTARLKVRTHHYCVDAYQLVNGFQFTKDFFCASLRNGTRDACLFDAGAPAVQRNQLMGIMSFGPERCGHEYQPAVFVKAFYFRDFVKRTVSAYKTTAEIIEAMQDLEQTVRPPLQGYQTKREINLDEFHKTEKTAASWELFTKPDFLHD